MVNTAKHETRHSMFSTFLTGLDFKVKSVVTLTDDQHLESNGSFISHMDYDHKLVLFNVSGQCIDSLRLVFITTPSHGWSCS